MFMLDNHESNTYIQTCDRRESFALCPDMHNIEIYGNILFGVGYYNPISTKYRNGLDVQPNTLVYKLKEHTKHVVFRQTSNCTNFSKS